MSKRKNKIGMLSEGFTLIEMLVAIGIFSVVMTMTAAAFLNITDLQAKTESFRKVNDNLNFSMEAMMREIREGYDYDCDGVTGCEDGGGHSKISFTWRDPEDSSEKTISYEMSVNEGRGYIRRTFEGDSGSTITSDSVNIKDLSFTTRGVEKYDNGDRLQPLVTISITAEAEYNKKAKSTLNLQTTVSQRKLDTGYTF